MEKKILLFVSLVLMMLLPNLVYGDEGFETFKKMVNAKDAEPYAIRIVAKGYESSKIKKMVSDRLKSLAIDLGLNAPSKITIVDEGEAVVMSIVSKKIPPKEIITSVVVYEPYKDDFDESVKKHVKEMDVEFVRGWFDAAVRIEYHFALKGSIRKLNKLSNEIVEDFDSKMIAKIKKQFKEHLYLMYTIKKGIEDINDEKK